jgi:hypothetical protein
MKNIQQFITFTFCLIICSTLSQAIELHPKFKVNGYSSFEYEYMLDDTGKGDPNGSFDADLFDLVFNIFPTDRLRVTADLTWEHGAATEDNRGNVAIEYAFGEYTIRNNFRMRAGKMFSNFGIYNEIHTAKPAFLTVKEPQSTNKNHKFGSGDGIRFYPRWSTGLALLNDGMHGNNEYDWILQLSNGEQVITNPNEEDNNSLKAIGGRFRYNLENGIKLGSSFYYDSLEDKLTGYDKQLSYGIQLEYNPNAFGLELEYVKGTVDNPSGISVELDRWAYTAMLFYTYKSKYTPYLRYEYLDPNKAIDSDTANLSILGLNIKIDPSMTWKIEFDIYRSDKNNARFSGDGFTEFKTAFAIGF